jgi:hypothetical protein
VPTVVLGEWWTPTAEIIAGRLRSEGIEVFPLPIDSYSAGGRAFVRLMVVEADERQARSIIETAELHR